MGEQSLSSGFMNIKEERDYHYLTPKDLAERYRVSERQITHLARNGYLPGFRFGKLWRFRSQDIETWENGQFGREEIEKLAEEIVNGG